MTLQELKPVVDFLSSIGGFIGGIAAALAALIAFLTYRLAKAEKQNRGTSGSVPDSATSRTPSERVVELPPPPSRWFRRARAAAVISLISLGLLAGEYMRQQAAAEAAREAVKRDEAVKAAEAAARVEAAKVEAAARARAEAEKAMEAERKAAAELAAAKEAAEIQARRDDAARVTVRICQGASGSSDPQNKCPPDWRDRTIICPALGGPNLVTWILERCDAAGGVVKAMTKDGQASGAHCGYQWFTVQCQPPPR